MRSYGTLQLLKQLAAQLAHCQLQCHDIVVHVVSLLINISLSNVLSLLNIKRSEDSKIEPSLSRKGPGVARRFN